MAAHEARQAEVLRRRAFAVYGLDARWTGLRWMGGWGGSNDEVHHIDLAHGDPYDEGAPLARVVTWKLAPPMDDLVVANAAQGLAQHLWLDADAPHDLVRHAFAAEDPMETWSESALPIDGHRARFRLLAHGPHWIALTRTETRLITIEARHIDPADVALMTIDDIEPYLGEGPSPH